ncbi:MAG: hypothetical protein SCM11_06720 [Bacillota bacterium]|nr:hypothetical protein [Bacillota bacterium]
MDNSIIKKYRDYASKIGDRKALFEAVAKEFSVHNAIYPGSHIDIAPSLVIPEVIYIDNFKGAISFFKHLDIIIEYIEDNKKYSDACKIDFIGQDYTQPFEIEQVDLIISQYAGFVGQATKRYLKIGGILLCNDSHGDATMARFDDDFEFIGIVDNQNRIHLANMEKYFNLPKGRSVDLEIVKANMKGLKYTLGAENYIFRKLTP